MNNLCFYPHPSSLNHGCEAIIVSTILILNKYETFEFYSSLLVKYDIGSSKLGDDTAYSLVDNVITCPMPSMKPYSYTWVKYQLGKLLHKDNSCELLSEVFKENNKNLIDNNDVFISIGGDNYCYGRPVPFYAVHKAIIHKKSILWGCSIEPSCITDEMIEDLKGYNTIVARESLTFDALLSKGLNNVVLFPDPAFVLPIGKGPLLKKPTVGLNVSPMIFDYSKNSRILYKAFQSLINYIIENTSYDIALIPHVTATTTDDRNALKRLLIDGNSRIQLFEDSNCMDLKKIISQCDMFIGSRTHSTIAAYSSCVPTLVCGYSVKSKGIAKDIFGTFENYVIPVQDIENENELIISFQWLLQNKDEIRNHLLNFMPSYIKKAYDAGGIILDVCK